MSKDKIKNIRPTANIGLWLSAKIYSDMKKGCSCGSDAWNSTPIRGLPGYETPTCSKCGKDPELYVIVATVKDETGLKKRIKIRHTQDGKRLKEYLDVTYTLQQVLREIKEESFDVRRYESQESRESFRFDRVVENYLGFHEKRVARGDLSPGGLKDKKTLIKNHLAPWFKEMDIAFITAKKVKEFFNSYTESLRMRDKATSELKTILYFAKDELELIPGIPKFPEIAAAKTVDADNFLSKEKQALVISKIEDPLYRAAIQTMAIYALRPCEVRSLKWKDIDLHSGVLYIRSHISLNQDIPGRKSQASASHSLPIVPEFQAILDSLVRSIDSNAYVFPGKNGGAIGGNVVTRAWNDACKLARVKNVTLYQGTKHSTLSHLGKTASDAQLRRLSGHTNTKILQRYAQSHLNDVRELLQ
jgi:integrase